MLNIRFLAWPYDHNLALEKHKAKVILTKLLMTFQDLRKLVQSQTNPG